MVSTTIPTTNRDVDLNVNRELDDEQSNDQRDHHGTNDRRDDLEGYHHCFDYDLGSFDDLESDHQCVDDKSHDVGHDYDQHDVVNYGDDQRVYDRDDLKGHDDFDDIIRVDDLEGDDQRDDLGLDD